MSMYTTLTFVSILVSIISAAENVRRVARDTNTVYDKPASKQLFGEIAPKRQTFHVEIFVVVDSTIFIRYNSNSGNVTSHVHEIINMVDTLYRPLNVRVTIVGIEIWSEDMVFISTDNLATLQRFNDYVKNKAPYYDMADHVHLLTGKGPFDGGSVGVAHNGTVCSNDYATGLSMDQSTANFTATIIAHELGHDLGMYHDDSAVCNCTAPNYCIMGPNGQPPLIPRVFSACSEKNLTDFLDNYYKPACLLNVPTVTNDVPTTCGNNVLDPGEECDCGDAYFCTNPCCNPNTCKLTEGSECYEGGCCNSCKIQAKGTCCGNVLNDLCDLTDHCDGNSSVCKDTYLEDRTSCGVGGKCYQGKCQSHFLQCDSLWGNGVKNGDDECYDQLNTKGSWYGHCGANGDYTACATADVKCGKLYCGNIPQQFPIVGWKKGVDLMNVTSNNITHSCASPRIDSGRNQTNETMVEDGTPCGTNRMCQDQKCVALQTFKSMCTCVNGFCTNEGKCVCRDGMTGATCNIAIPVTSNIGCLPPDYVMSVDTNNKEEDHDSDAGEKLSPAMAILSCTMFHLTCIVTLPLYIGLAIVLIVFGY